MLVALVRETESETGAEGLTLLEEMGVCFAGTFQPIVPEFEPVD